MNEGSQKNSPCWSKWYFRRDALGVDACSSSRGPRGGLLSNCQNLVKLMQQVMDMVVASLKGEKPHGAGTHKGCR